MQAAASPEGGADDGPRRWPPLERGSAPGWSPRPQASRSFAGSPQGCSSGRGGPTPAARPPSAPLVPARSAPPGAHCGGGPPPWCSTLEEGEGDLDLRLAGVCWLLLSCFGKGLLRRKFRPLSLPLFPTFGGSFTHKSSLYAPWVGGKKSLRSTPQKKSSIGTCKPFFHRMKTQESAWEGSRSNFGSAVWTKD